MVKLDSKWCSDFARTKITMDSGFQAISRELAAQQSVDAVAKKIADESRKLDPNQLVTRIDGNQIYAKIVHDSKKGLCYQIG